MSPQRVEMHVSRDSVVEQMMTIGDNRKYITALIVPSIPNLQNIAKTLDRHHLPHHELIKDDLIIEHLYQRFEKVQKELNPYERVVKFILLPEPFSVENKSLTSTLKVRRRIVMEHYKDEIDRMY